MVMPSNPGATDAMQAKLAAMRGGAAAPPVAAPPQEAAPQETPLDAVKMHLVEALKALQAMSEA
jgi:hypothetical protein